MFSWFGFEFLVRCKKLFELCTIKVMTVGGKNSSLFKLSSIFNLLTPEAHSPMHGKRVCHLTLIKRRATICCWIHIRSQSKDIQCWSVWLITCYTILNEQHSARFNKFEFSVFVQYKLQITHAVNFSIPTSADEMNKFVLCSLLFSVKRLSTDADHPINSFRFI